VKVKMRFDKESLKAFFLGNVEKIVFGAILIGCGLMIYFSGRKTFTDPLPAPKTLQDLTSQADSNVKNTIPAKCPLYQDLKVTDYTAVAGRSEDRVEEKSYPMPTPWNGPVFDAKILRDDPAIFAVQNLRAVFGRGPFTRQGGAAGGANVYGYRWIVITGAIPVKKQLDEYLRVFQPAVHYDSRADVPQDRRNTPTGDPDVGYVIERAEVGSRSAGQEVEWKAIDVKTALKRAAYIGNPLPDTLPAKFINAELVFPLPPLATKQWGPETQHEDLVGPPFDKVQKDPAGSKDRKVVWMGDSVRIVQTPEELEARPVVVFTAKLTTDPGKKPEERMFAVLYGSKDELDRYGKSGLIKGKVAGVERIKLPVAGTPEGKPVNVPLLIHEAPAPKADDRDDGPGPEVEGPMPGRPGAGGRPRPGAGAVAERDEPVDYKLFRFFDLNVEPGKHYQYRVRLVLENPNYLEQPKGKPKPGEERRRDPLQSRFLKNPASGADEFRTTDPTPPTEPVTVPEDVRLLALSVAPAKPFGRTGVADPAGMSGKMAVVQWVPASGREVRHEFEAQRGTLASFPAQKPSAKPAEQPAKSADSQPIVVDMHITQLNKDTNGAGEIVVVDGQGNLRVYNQLEGEMEYMLLVAKPAEGAPGAVPGGETPPDQPPGERPTRRPPVQEGPPTRALNFDREP
jgi:hypothetical protein